MKSPLNQLGLDIKAAINQIFSPPINLNDRKLEPSTNLYAHIHQKFQNPNYLDGLELLSDGVVVSNDSAIADFLTIVGTHRAANIFLSEESQVRMSDLSIVENIDIQRHLQILLKQLKKLSHGSGRVAGRKNGALAFSHWIEAGYLYLLYDPRPSIEGLYQVLCHDIYEDTKWYIKPTKRQDR